MKREARIQESEFRSQNADRGGRQPRLWMAALALGMAAGCASPKAQFTDAEWVSHSTTGRGCHERGDDRRAAEAYGRAQQRARALDDADALAVSAVNRAVCLLVEGKAPEALSGVNEALADGRVAKGRQAELRVAGARVLLALGQVEEAWTQANEALKLAPPPPIRAQALLTRSAAELAKGESILASKSLLDGLSASAWSRLPDSLRAEVAARRAEIAVAEQRPAEAAALQDEAAERWKQAGRLPEMARALAEAGRQAQASGDLSGACDRLWRAARSLWAQGFQSEAVRTLEQGISCAEQLENEAVAKRMAELFVTFKNAKRLTE